MTKNFYLPSKIEIYQFILRTKQTDVDKVGGLGESDQQMYQYFYLAQSYIGYTNAASEVYRQYNLLKNIQIGYSIIVISRWC